MKPETARLLEEALIRGEFERGEAARITGLPERTARRVLNDTIALGLLGSWRLIGRFADGDKRIAATALLLLTPFYTFLSWNYNANSIFLSIWPWTLYAFVRAIDGGKRITSNHGWSGVTIRRCAT